MTRRDFAKRAGLATAGAGLLRRQSIGQTAPDHTIVIGPCTVEASPKHIIHTTGYNGQVPGPLLRLHEGRPVVIEVTNKTDNPEIVHRHEFQGKWRFSVVREIIDGPVRLSQLRRAYFPAVARKSSSTRGMDWRNGLGEPPRV